MVLTREITWGANLAPLFHLAGDPEDHGNNHKQQRQDAIEQKREKRRNRRQVDKKKKEQAQREAEEKAQREAVQETTQWEAAEGRALWNRAAKQKHRSWFQLSEKQT